MDYLKLYNRLTSLKNTQNEYYESHHIIPKCLGGSNDQSNLIMLTARQHFIAHKLLIKIYPNNSLLHHAFAMMASTNRYQNRVYTSKQYSEMKNSRSLAMKLDNPMQNKDVSNRMSKTRKDLFAKGLLTNPMDSLEARKKLSDHMKKNNPNKGGAWNHTSYPIEIIFNDGSSKIYSYMKEAANELSIPYASMKAARRNGSNMKKYGIKQIIKVEG